MGKVLTWDDLGTPAEPVAPAATAPAVPVAPPDDGKKKVITFDQLGTPPEDYTPPTVMEDLPPSAVAGVGKGVAGLVGLPGALTYYANKAEKAIRGKLQGEQAAEDWARSKEEGLPREARQAIAEGNASPFRTPFGTLALPTMQGAQKVGEEYVPGIAYDPATLPGKMTEGALNFGVQALAGGPKGAGRNFVTGLGAGAVAPVTGAAGEQLAGTTGKIVGEVGGAMVADLLSHKIADFATNIVAPSGIARDQIVDAVRADLATNPALQEKLKQAVANGEPIYLSDYLKGEAATKLLSANYSPKQQFAMQRINQALEQRKGAVEGMMDDEFGRLFNRDLRDEAFATSVANANKTERDKLYTDMKALPQSQVMMSSDLANLATTNGYVREAMASVNKLFRDGKIDPKWGVSPPMGGLPGNIQYWDLVKREIDPIIKDAKTNGKSNILGGAQNAKDSLTTELDKILPEYGQVRNKAAEMFGAENSLEGGYKFANALAGGSPFKTGEFIQSFGRLTPGQKEEFAAGAARAVMQRAKGDMGGLVSYMENPNVNRVLRGVMGPDRFDQLYAKSVAANLMAKAEGFSFVSSGDNRGIAKLLGEMAGGVGVSAGTTALLTNDITSLATLGTAALGAISGAALNASERRVADKVISLAFSRNPNNAAELGRLLAKNYDAVSAVRKISDYMASATQKGIIAYIDSQREPDYGMGEPLQSSAMNTGGRVARKSGGRVRNPISSEVRRVRTLLSNQTASILSMPDDAVATALHIAKR